MFIELFYLKHKEPSLDHHVPKAENHSWTLAASIIQSESVGISEEGCLKI